MPHKNCVDSFIDDLFDRSRTQLVPYSEKTQVTRPWYGLLLTFGLLNDD